MRAIPDHGGLARQTLIYGLAGVAPQLVGFITLPIFSRAFSEAQYGILEIALASLSVLATAADIGLTSASQRSYFDYQDADRQQRRSVVTTAVVTAAVVSLVFAVVALALRDWLSHLLFGSNAHVQTVELIAVTVPALVLGALLREAMRLRFLAFHYLLSAMLTAAIGAAIGIFAVVVYDAGVNAVIVGLLAANFAAAIYGAVAMRSDLGRAFSRFELRRMLHYGLPLVPAALALWALALVDRLMLQNLANISDVGEYAAANRVAMVVQLGSTGFALALAPYLLSIYSEDRELEKVTRGRTLTYLAFTLGAVALALTLLAHELVEILAPDYGDAYLAVGPVAFGWVAFGIATLVMAGISLARRTLWFAVLAGTAAAFNIGLNFVLIPAWGMIGAAIATAAAYGLLAILYYVVAQHVYRTPYEPMRVVVVIALAALWSAPGYVVYDSPAVAVAVKVGAVVGFAASVLLTRTLGLAELRELWRFLTGMVALRRRSA